MLDFNMDAFVSKPLDERRIAMTDLMSDYSEARFAAGWLYGLDRVLFEQGHSEWRALAFICEGWPIGYHAEGGWMSFTEATAYYQSEYYHDE
jgi:hypothetical protein